MLAGVDGYLQKPLGAAELTSNIQRWIYRLQRTIPLPLQLKDGQPAECWTSNYVKWVCTLAEGNMSKTARLLQMHRTTVAGKSFAPVRKNRKKESNREH